MLFRSQNPALEEDFSVQEEISNPQSLTAVDSELAEIIVSVGLAQNMAALRALATEGIQRGHMSLHARQVAVAAGAEGEMIEKVAAQMVAEKTVRIDRAEELLKEWGG